MTDMDTADVREEVLNLVAYVLTSARGLYREPQSYGPMRMVDSLERCLDLLRKTGVSGESLEQPMSVIRDSRWKAGSDPAGFAAALDEAIHKLVQITVESTRKQGQPY